MSNCTNCGNPLDASDTRCSHCGATVTTQSQSSQKRSGYTSTQQVAYPRQRSESRSIQLPILAAFSAIAGIESLLFAASQNFNPKLTQLNQVSSMFGFATSYMPYILGIAGVLALAATFGYFKRTSWAWKIGLVSAIVSAFTIVAPNLYGFVLGIVCLGLLFMPSVRSSLRH